jgi:hypothetical protein
MGQMVASPPADIAIAPWHGGMKENYPLSDIVCEYNRKSRRPERKLTK